MINSKRIGVRQCGHLLKKEEKKENIKKTEKEVKPEERTVELEEKLDVAEIESVTEYESGMVVLKYTNSKDEPCNTKLTRIIPEGGPTDLGPLRK